MNDERLQEIINLAESMVPGNTITKDEGLLAEALLYLHSSTLMKWPKCPGCGRYLKMLDNSLTNVWWLSCCYDYKMHSDPLSALKAFQKM